MVEALRGLGYSAPTALADIVDNSIAAGASRVDVQFRWAGPASTVSVLDDGHGMSEGELDAAMRLGELDPRAARAPGDLGRFGLGLKTASFSQARRLTVASRRDGEVSVLRWDLDLLAADPEQEWWLLEGTAPGSEWITALLPTTSSGTAVVWEVPDRLVPAGSNEQDFLDLIDLVEHHLATVFHRYLERSRERITIAINGREIQPWNPFLASHPATWTSPLVTWPGAAGSTMICGHVLPHRDRLSAEEYAAAAGPDGWTAQQGFYVYRNERLLLAGGWLGLGKPRPWTKEEPFRLARIRVDIPNTADAEWKIDIRKSRARPPPGIRNRLWRFAEDTRARARRVFAHRGQPHAPSNRDAVVQAWRADHFAGGMRYRVNLDHPSVRAVLDEAGELELHIKAMLRVIEETIPVQRIWLDTAESKDTPRIGFAAQPPAEVAAVLAVLYRGLVRRKGVPPPEARARLLRTEPFSQYAELVAALPDEP
jgi:hypothetical protein